MLENYMVSRLFKLERHDEDTRSLKDTYKESDFMKPRNFYNPKEYFRDMVPSKVRLCKGCKPDRLELGFEKARDLMENETNIIEIIKSIRYYNTALRFLLSKK